jgi:hypothetical protein
MVKRIFIKPQTYMEFAWKIKKNMKPFLKIVLKSQPEAFSAKH